MPCPGPLPRRPDPAPHRCGVLLAALAVLALAATPVACQRRTAEAQPAPPPPRAQAQARAPAPARAGAAAAAPVRAAAPVAPARAPAPASGPVAREPSGFTFFVAADPHYGFEDVRDYNRRMIEEMNRLPGTPYPAELGGRVQPPLGVLVAGDLTENGRPTEWQQFRADFGLTGTDGLLRYPVFEASGNHDRRRGRHAVLDGVRRRHQGLTYSWDWHGVHFASLDRYPAAANRRWLAKDLAQLRTRQPVVLFFHYNLEGPYSRYFKPAERAVFRDTVAAHNVIAVFHGHYHPEQRYVWSGIDVFDVGSPFWDTTFAVVRITESHLQVASWDWVERRWGTLFRKSLAPRPASASAPAVTVRPRSSDPAPGGPGPAAR